MKIIFITASLLLFSEFLFGQGDKEFFDAIRSLEGKTYYGKAIYMPDTTKANDFWGKKLSFKVNGINKSKFEKMEKSESEREKEDRYRRKKNRFLMSFEATSSRFLEIKYHFFFSHCFIASKSYAEKKFGLEP